jgi:hypothetical protein
MPKLKKQNVNPYGPRAMQTDDDRLRFAVNFAQADLKALRRGDRLNLRDDLFMFAHSVPYSSDEDLEVNAGDVFLSRKIALREMSDEQIEKVRGEFLEILDGLSMPKGRSRFATVGPLPRLQFYAGEGEGGATIIFASSQDPREVLLYRLMRLLESSANTSRLQICPECRRIYIKVKRQKYCSQRCANRAYIREWRSSKGESKANHKQYEKRTKAKTAKSVQVGRRPRRRS